ncbi:MAG: glycosyltransferase [Candidatus Omnitrophica bacterium]|nr:glycosyltransferase [Candidatus Omnitrophota bacterium]
MNDSPSVSFVLPMYNESANITASIRKIKSIAPEMTPDHEIIIADDASTDGSADIVESISRKDSSVKLIRLPENTMFGGAFAAGFKAASKDVIMYMDADMPVGEEDIKRSFPLIKNAHIVTGYSKVKKGDTLKRKIISVGYNLLVRSLFRLDIRDINSGYKIVRRELVEDMQFISRSPFVDVELFLHAKRKGARVEQYPLVFTSRPGGKSYIARIPVIWATFCDMIKVRALTLKG